MLTDDELKKKLTPEQYAVCHDAATEPPFSGKYVHHHEDGTYTCVICSAELFRSDAKFDSGSGWPSFDDVVSADAVELSEDKSRGMNRTEVKCKRCGSHLGHLFQDGPTKTGARYCINSVAVDFKGKDGTIGDT